MPSREDIDRLREEAIPEVIAAYLKRGREMAEREIDIAMGQVREPSGVMAKEQPTYAVQASTLKSIREQMLGAPVQRTVADIRSVRISGPLPLPQQKLTAVDAEVIDEATLPQLAAATEVPTIHAQESQRKRWLSNERVTPEDEGRMPRPGEIVLPS